MSPLWAIDAGSRLRVQKIVKVRKIWSSFRNNHSSTAIGMPSSVGATANLELHHWTAPHFCADLVSMLNCWTLQCILIVIFHYSHQHRRKTLASSACYLPSVVSHLRGCGQEVGAWRERTIHQRSFARPLVAGPAKRRYYCTRRWMPLLLPSQIYYTATPPCIAVWIAATLWRSSNFARFELLPSLPPPLCTSPLTNAG